MHMDFGIIIPVNIHGYLNNYNAFSTLFTIDSDYFPVLMLRK